MLEGPLDRRADRFEHFDPRPLLVVRLDEMPGGGLGARAVDHVADRALVGLPLSAVSPIFLRNLEAFERRLLARVEALELFCLAYGQPEFNDDDAEADQRLLEIDDLAVSAHPVFLGGKTLDPLDE